MKNIFVLDKNYKKIGTLSNEGANPQAPYYEDLYTQELETGADTYQFSTTSSKYTQDILEIGNHIMFAYKNKYELFTITSLEYSHSEGYKTIGVYAEGIGFDLLEVYMERPEVPEKEENKDNGGSDKVYIDEDGNIIYDPDGDGETGGDITIDGDGNIIYTPSKNNKKNDSLEFKNISYPRFLSMLLKNSGWSYSCQPGLESVKHDITVRYDTNIYAILQDSMQAYRGVELQFSYAMMGGQVHKIIMAYKDGGRGSFVGKRFEYGTNVRGITKMQEVANSEDDTVLYVDDVGIAVQYDVDFALKSAEVPEIEIGDTHYVIDRDFCPPMTIKARIGKIEISFSDPTKNKIYLANNKRISGSAIEEEFNEDDIKDIIDDYDPDYDPDDPGIATDHDHDRLVSYNGTNEDDKTYVILDNMDFVPYEHDHYNLGSEDTHWQFAYTGRIENRNYINSPRYFGYEYDVYFDRKSMTDIERITDSSEITKQDLLDFIVNDLKIYEYSSIRINEANNEYVDDPGAYVPNVIRFGILSEDLLDHNSGDDCFLISDVGDRIASGVIESDTDGDDDTNDDDGHNAHVYDLSALVCALIGAFQHYVSGNSPNPPSEGEEGGSGNNGYFDNISVYNQLDTESLIVNTSATVGNLYIRGIEVVFPDGTKCTSRGWEWGSGSGGNPGTGGSGSGSTGTDNPGSGSYGDIIVDSLKIYSPEDDNYVPVRLTNEGIGAKIIVADYEVSTPKLRVTDEEPDDASINIPPEIVVRRRRSGDPAELKITPDGITFPDNSTLTSANGLSGEGVTPGTGGGTDSCGAPAGAFEADNTNGINNLIVKMHTYFEKSVTVRNNNVFVQDGGNLIVDYVGDGISTSGGYIGCHTLHADSQVNTINVIATMLNGQTLANNSDKSLKENIRYIDAPTTYSNDDLLEKSDLHDFIVNQVNICEYNFIDDDKDKIGFIANEYEGTKVGDKIVTRNKETDLLSYDVNNLLFATIGALQEEVRIKDEKIASLEDRLAKIEAMLGINDNN